MKIFQFILFVFISTLSFSQIKYQKDAGKIEAFPAALKAPKDAPNVILIMLDDLGFEKEKPNFTTADISLFMDNEELGKLENIKMAVQYSLLSGFGLLIGKNEGASISHAYQTPFDFNDNLEKIIIKIDE